MSLSDAIKQQYYQKLIDFVTTVSNKTVDELQDSLMTVVALDSYQKIEKQIIAQLGQEQGEKAIYSIKRNVAQVEKKMGGVVLQDAVERLEAIFSLARLYGANGSVPVADHNNQDSQSFVLVNDNGEVFHFEKFAQITYKGAIHFELHLLDDLKIGKINHYKVVYEDGKQVLVRVRDKQQCDELYELCEIYS